MPTNPPFTNLPQPARKIMPFAPPHPSPSLNEGVLGEVAENDPVRMMVQEAIRHARIAAEKSRTVSIAIHADTSQSEGGRHVSSAAVSYKVTHAALPLIDRARENLMTAITACKIKTKGPPQDTSISGHMQAAELRALLASLSGKARMDAIAKSLAEGDDSLAASALHASRFLTGMSELEQTHVRMQWAQKRQPDALARLKILESDLQHLERTGQLLIGYQLKCSDPMILAAARKNSEAARAAVAAAMN